MQQRILLCFALFVLSLHAVSGGTNSAQISNVLSIPHIPHQRSSSAELKQIKDFLVANTQFSNVTGQSNGGADWRVVVQDQVVFLLFLHEHLVELSAFEYDLSFTDCGTANPSNFRLIGSAQKEGKILSSYLTRFYRYDLLINKLLNELIAKISYDKKNTAPLIILAHPEISHRYSVELKEKLVGIKSAKLSYELISVCKDCDGRVFLPEYAYYHNLINHLTDKVFPQTANKVKSDEKDNIFMGWSDSGFYFAAPQKYVNREDFGLLENRSSLHCSSSLNNSLYFDSFLALPSVISDIESLLSARKPYAGCFDSDSDYGEKCIEAVDKYFTDRVKLYVEMKEFGEPLNYNLNSILRFTKTSSSSINRIVIENKNLSNYLIYDEDLDIDTSHFSLKVEDIKEKGKEICRQSYAKNKDTHSFSNYQFCLSILVLGYEIEAMFQDKSSEVYVNLGSGPESRSWIYGALVDNLITYHNSDQDVFDSIKNDASSFMSTSYGEEVMRITLVFLGATLIVVLYGYIQSYRAPVSEYQQTSSKEI